VKNLKELLELMKAKPAQINYGTGGVGGSIHLAFELFQTMGGVKATHIPCKGVGPALVDTVGGRVQMMIAGLPPALGHIRANRLRARRHDDEAHRVAAGRADGRRKRRSRIRIHHVVSAARSCSNAESDRREAQRLRSPGARNV
jgi:hypothetical protein